MDETFIDRDDERKEKLRWRFRGDARVDRLPGADIGDDDSQTSYFKGPVGCSVIDGKTLKALLAMLGDGIRFSSSPKPAPTPTSGTTHCGSCGRTSPTSSASSPSENGTPSPGLTAS